MAGSENLFDSVQITASSEYSSRQGEKIDTLQIHHATMTSLSGLISMMQPGGRTVSANGALGNDGHLVEVVPLANRAFTSASSYDRRCLTVETCNTTLSPTWGISEASRLRLARLAVDMYRKGMLGSLTRKHIIGHYEVPGTYATACPGPDMNLDRIVQLANEIYKGSKPAIERGLHLMSYSLIKDAGSPTVYVQSLISGDRKGIASPYHLQLLDRVRKNAGDEMLTGELDIVDGYLTAINPPAGVAKDRTDEVLAAIKAIAISPEAVRDAIKAALSEGIQIDADVSDEQLDAAAERFAKLLGVRISGGDLAGA